MSHSYEEVRSIALEVLAGKHPKLKWGSDVSQYENFRLAVAEVLARQDGRFREDDRYQPPFDAADGEIFLEVFWELFRQGIITLGLNNSNREFPWFRVTQFGRQLMEGEPYFFHDVSSYEKILQREIPNLDAATLLYLKEAFQAFRAGCLLSSTVMLGVSAEHAFLQLIETIENNPAYAPIYAGVSKERMILQKITKFKSVLDQHIKTLPSDLKEDLDTQFLGIQSVIRTFRNQAGHPTGKIPGREQTYVLLQLYVSYCKKLYRMREYFAQAP